MYVIVISTLIAVLFNAFEPSDRQQPLFRAKSTYVQLDMIATDGANRRVEDLTSSDVEIFVEGRRQEVASFSRIVVPLEKRRLNLGGLASPAPRVFTNAPPPQSSRAFAFVIDTVSAENIVAIRRMFNAFLESISANDEVAVVFNGRPDLGQDFTEDVGAVVKSLNNLKAAMTSPTPRNRLDECLRPVVDSLSTVRQSRRAIIYVSEGAIALRTDIKPDMSQILALEELKRAARLNVPIYSIDPRGLMAPDLGLRGHLEDQGPQNNRSLNQAIFLGKQGLKTIANLTGGLAFADAWDVSGAAKAIVADNSDYYLIGFYPDPDPADGKFHEVTVRISRPGVVARSRRGYTADKSSDGQARSLTELLRQSVPSGGLELRAEVSPRSEGDRVSMRLIVEVRFPEPDSSDSDQLELAWIAIDPGAKLLSSGRQVVAVSRDLVSARKAILSLDLQVPTQATSLRVAISSRATRLQGSVFLRLGR